MFVFASSFSKIWLEMLQLKNNLRTVKKIWLVNIQNPWTVCRGNDTEKKSEVIMTEPQWRAKSHSQQTKEAENQQSALWEVISCHNKSMLVIGSCRLMII